MMTRLSATCLAAALFLITTRNAPAQTTDESTFKSLQFRAIGPAVMGGRIDDVAVVERNPSGIFVSQAVR